MQQQAGQREREMHKGRGGKDAISSRCHCQQACYRRGGGGGGGGGPIIGNPKPRPMVQIHRMNTRKSGGNDVSPLVPIRACVIWSWLLGATRGRDAKVDGRRWRGRSPSLARSTECERGTRPSMPMRTSISGCPSSHHRRICRQTCKRATNTPGFRPGGGTRSGQKRQPARWETKKAQPRLLQGSGSSVLLTSATSPPSASSCVPCFVVLVACTGKSRIPDASGTRSNTLMRGGVCCVGRWRRESSAAMNERCVSRVTARWRDQARQRDPDRGRRRGRKKRGDEGGGSEEA